jgi:hypothetical protein
MPPPPPPVSLPPKRAAKRSEVTRPALEPHEHRARCDRPAWQYACAASLHGWVAPDSPYYTSGHTISADAYAAALDAATTPPPYQPHAAAIRGR